jgi:hypothetical protein
MARRRRARCRHRYAAHDVLVQRAQQRAVQRLITTPKPRTRDPGNAPGSPFRARRTVERIAWDDLPGQLVEAIEARTGPIIATSAVTDGLNSPLAAVIDTCDGKVFAEGIPIGHRRAVTQDREAAVAPYLAGIAPALQWHFSDAGWNVLGFENVPGRAADYRPGSPDLDRLVQVMQRL